MNWSGPSHTSSGGRKKSQISQVLVCAHLSNAAGALAGSSVAQSGETPTSQGSLEKHCQGPFQALTSTKKPCGCSQGSCATVMASVAHTGASTGGEGLPGVHPPPHSSYTFCCFSCLPPVSDWHQGNCPKLALLYQKILCCLVLAWIRPLNAQIRGKIAGKVLI